MKKCPKCKSTLSPKDIGPVMVDECHTCKGLWFDSDELRQAKDDADPDLHWLNFEIWKHPEQFESTQTALPCPNCEKPITRIIYGKTGVRIGYCPSCRGTWLDKEKFKTIIESLEEELLNKSFADYLKESLAEAREIITGKESFISEWQDFTTVLRLMQYRLFAEKPALLHTLENINRSSPIR